MQLKIPDLGGASETTVAEVLVKVGDTIAVDQPIVTLESEKASMEVPASSAGVVQEVAVEVGQSVSEGQVMVVISPDGAEKSSQPLCLPDLGTDEAVTVIEWAVSVGDSVEKEQVLLVLEGEKAAMEVPSPMSGVLLSQTVRVGDSVKSLQQVGEIRVDSGQGIAEKPVQQSEPTVVERSIERSVHTAVPTGSVYASPLVRRLAAELQIDLATVPATGHKGRLTRADLLTHIQQAMSQPSLSHFEQAWRGEAVDYSRFGPVEERALNKIQLATKKQMVRSWLSIPQVTQQDKADVTELEAWRQQGKADWAAKGVRMTLLAFVVKAVTQALQSHTTINASLSESGESLIVKNYYHIGIAVDTPQGLVVPVLRDVEKKSVEDIAKEMAELSQIARAGQLTPAQMQGACFTISSLGGIGGSWFSPIVNPPQVAILGIGKADWQAVWDGSNFAARLQMPLSLSYDHRVVDGAVGIRFLRAVITQLEGFTQNK